jgi:hypothetical protein
MLNTGVFRRYLASTQHMASNQWPARTACIVHGLSGGWSAACVAHLCYKMARNERWAWGADIGYLGLED